MSRTMAVAEMRRLVLTTLLLPFLLAGAHAQVPDVAPKPFKNVLLISWDGADRRVMNELLQAGKLSNLAALIEQGSMQDIDVLGHMTATKPSHAQMLTGLDDETTGVISNSKSQPIPEGYTIFERVQAALGKENIRAFMIAGKINNVGGRGPGEAPGVGKGEPFFLTRKHLDLFDAADRDLNEVCALGVKAIQRFHSPRFLGFLHFADPDRMAHRNGAESEAYRTALQQCDDRLGYLMAYLRELEIANDTLVYVTADHGFNGKNHDNAPLVWLATNDKAVTHGGTQADIPAMILTRFGVDLAKLDPPIIGVPLTGPVHHETPAQPAKDLTPVAQ